MERDTIWSARVGAFQKHVFVHRCSDSLEPQYSREKMHFTALLPDLMNENVTKYLHKKHISFALQTQTGMDVTGDIKRWQSNLKLQGMEWKHLLRFLSNTATFLDFVQVFCCILLFWSNSDGFKSCKKQAYKTEPALLPTTGRT